MPASALLLGKDGFVRPLRPGDEVVGRVVEAPGGDGQGLLSVAGALQPARLPAWAVPGMTLRLRVLEARGFRLFLAAALLPPRTGRRGRLDVLA